MMGLPAGLGALKGAGGSTPWLVTANLTKTGGESGWNGYTLRILVPGSALAAGSRVRFRLGAGTLAGGLMNIGAAYFGKQAASGDPWDFAAAPTQVLFGGLSGVSISNNSERVSDEVVMAVTAEPHLLSVYFNGASDVAVIGSAPGFAYYYRLANDPATVNASGYTSSATDLSRLLLGVEVYQP